MSDWFGFLMGVAFSFLLFMAFLLGWYAATHPESKP